MDLISISLLAPPPLPTSPTTNRPGLYPAASIANYPGNCPCPYNVDRAGRACGKRSAYSKQGGYAPLCYPSDITDEMITEYRRANAGST